MRKDSRVSFTPSEAQFLVDALGVVSKFWGDPPGSTDFGVFTKLGLREAKRTADRLIRKIKMQPEEGPPRA